MTVANLAALCMSSGLAVAGSLIYLAVQTNLSTRNTRPLIHQGAAARTTAIKLGMMEADRSAAWVEGNSGRIAPPKDVRKAAIQSGLRNRHRRPGKNTTSSARRAW